MSIENNQTQIPKTQQSQEPQNQVQLSGNRPVETLRDGALKVAIFQNEREHGTNFSLEPGRIYTDKQGQIRESKTLSGSEPLRMSKLLDKGYERVGEFKAQLKQNQKKAEREQ